MHKLWYRQPAQNWNEALPLGNGRLGAMVWGVPDEERILLNVDTLWTGGPVEKLTPPEDGVLHEIRRLVLEEADYAAAHEMTKLLQRSDTAKYQPLGELRFTQVLPKNSWSNYRRSLVLDEAVSRVEFQVDGTRFEREVFVSHPHQAIVMKMTASSDDGPVRAISGRVALWCPHEWGLEVNPQGLALVGRVVDAERGPGMPFAAYVHVSCTGGSLKAGTDHLIIEDAAEVVITLTADTGFCGYSESDFRRGAQVMYHCVKHAQEITAIPYDQLLQEHINDFRSLFDRVRIYLGPGPDELPTDERLQKVKEGTLDKGLVALYFQYGRYLLISSSRPGSQPANLQGIWNWDLDPPWRSNYTLNINTQMNYWPAEVCNLAECHEPLFAMIRELRAIGSEMAGNLLGCRGWAAAHNTDLWRSAAPVGGGTGDASWAMWVMAGVWLCHHLWEHYEFSLDREFLKTEAYPAMRDAALFCLDWLVEDGEGYLTTCPSTSPENVFIHEGKRSAVAQGSAMDLSMIGSLFEKCIKAADILGIDQDLRKKLEHIASRLRPLQIGSKGQLLEWCSEFEEVEPGHRHVSHLWGLHPGDVITFEKTPRLMEAARKSLELRLAQGSGHTGWSRAWMINLWARLKNGCEAYANLQALLANSTLPNLLDTHPPFQIDGNFGGCAGIAEMLLQSHTGIIHLLPTLPEAWQQGYITGLRARGGFVVDLSWTDGALHRAVIRAERGTLCRVRSNGRLQVFDEVGQIIPSEWLDDQVLQFKTQIGRCYVVRPL
ncbi:MAG: glycoside hydrolase family 95 protein [Firmicutes bacterium]|nr:glycoside hydrolase family 95 protein [Bacillota bacterium]